MAIELRAGLGIGYDHQPTVLSHESFELLPSPMEIPPTDDRLGANLRPG